MSPVTSQPVVCPTCGASLALVNIAQAEEEMKKTVARATESLQTKYDEQSKKLAELQAMIDRLKEKSHQPPSP